MVNDPSKFDFTDSVNKLEEINSWFQNEDFNLDEGLQKLKTGKELIKKCRARLHDVENEFIQIKNEFVEEDKIPKIAVVVNSSDGKGTNPQSPTEKEISPDDVPF